MRANVQDGTGRAEERPALIISRDEENHQGLNLLVFLILAKSYRDPGEEPAM
jgi:hypothetical protein